MSAPTADAVRAFMRTRVRVLLANGDVHERTLSAFTPLDVLLLADPQGFELRVPRSDVRRISDAQYVCSECERKTNTRYAEDRCADCYRVWCMNQPVPSETCEVCGGGSAFYSPAAKYFACAQCHAKRGTLTGAGPEARLLQANARSFANCVGSDTDDTRHRWFRIKGKRYHCKNCPARRFNDPPFGTMWSENLSE